MSDYVCGHCQDKAKRDYINKAMKIIAAKPDSAGAQARAHEDDARDELIRQAARRRNAMWAVNNMADGDLIEALLNAFTVTHQDGSRHAAMQAHTEKPAP